MIPCPVLVALQLVKIQPLRFLYFFLLFLSEFVREAMVVMTYLCNFT